MALIRKIYREYSQADIDEACKLILATDEEWLRGRTLHACVAEAIVGGVTFVQLRTRHLEHIDAIRTARSIVPVCRVANVPLVVANDMEAAKAVGVDGVHIDKPDISCAAVRKELGRDVIVGVSVKTPEQAVNAEKSGASYLICGPAYAGRDDREADTLTKETIREISSAVSIPVAAMGGINDGDVSELSGLGLSGVAAVSAILAASDIEAAAAELMEDVEQYIRRNG